MGVILVDDRLRSYKTDDYSVRLCKSLLSVIPFAPPWRWYGSMEEAAKVLVNRSDAALIARATALAERGEYQKVLWLVDTLDTADKGITLASGLRSAVKVVQGASRRDALETDPQQAADAVLKGMALASIVGACPGGTVSERIATFRGYEAGNAMLLYYVAVEVGMPFADNTLSGGTTLVSTLFSRKGGEEIKRLGAVAGDDQAQMAAQVAQELSGTLDTALGAVGGYLGTLAKSVTEQLPKAMSVADQVASVAATGADALPVWRLLGARLVAEICVRQAALEIPEPEVAPPPVPSSVPTYDDPPPAPAAGRSPALLIFLVLAIVGVIGVAGAAAFFYLAPEPAPSTPPSITKPDFKKRP